MEENLGNFQCPRCAYTTTTKRYLLSHLRSVRPCATILCSRSREEILAELVPKRNTNDPFKCSYCDASFRTKQSRSRHQLHYCKARPTTKETQGEVNGLRRLVEQLAQEVQDLKKTVASAPSTQPINNITQNVLNATQNITINVRSFGQENIAHIKENKEFLTNCFLQKDIKTLLERIHCDEEHPENHNIKMKSLKRDMVETFIDGRWIVADTDETLDELVNKGYRILRYHCYKNKDDIKCECEDETEYDELYDWLESVYSCKEVREPIKRQLIFLIINICTLLKQQFET